MMIRKYTCKEFRLLNRVTDMYGQSRIVDYALHHCYLTPKQKSMLCDDDQQYAQDLDEEGRLEHQQEIRMEKI